MHGTSVDPDRTFVERFPHYASLLNIEWERAFVEERLRTVERRDEPFPHVWVEDLLSPGFHALLDAAWPRIEHFPLDERANRRDLVPAPPGVQPKDWRTSTYDAIPAPLREVWNYFVLDVNRRVIGPWLMKMFRPEIEDRLALIDSLWRNRLVAKDYYAPPFAPQMNVGRLMMRATGFRLRPHADALPYLVTALYYFPDQTQATEELGTTLYRAERPLSDDVIADTGKTVYFDKAGIGTSEAFHAPFRRNSLLAFANTRRSAHGMQIAATAGWRRAFQSHLSIKDDRDHL